MKMVYSTFTKVVKSFSVEATPTEIARFEERLSELINACRDQVDESTPIANMGFSDRTFNSLQRGGIETLAQLLQKTGAELLTIRFFGRVHLAEINEKLMELGIRPLETTALKNE